MFTNRRDRWVAYALCGIIAVTQLFKIVALVGHDLGWWGI